MDGLQISFFFDAIEGSQISLVFDIMDDLQISFFFDAVEGSRISLVFDVMEVC